MRSGRNYIMTKVTNTLSFNGIIEEQETEFARPMKRQVYPGMGFRPKERLEMRYSKS